MNKTIYDYVDWRGDLSPKEFPYNEIDFLIFAEFAYVKLDHLDIHSTPLSQLYVDYQNDNQQRTPEELIPIQNESHFLFEKMAHSLRYQNIIVLHYQSELDKNLIKQFFAVTLLLEDGRIVIAYRGTDDSLIGWHEDFLMLCENEVPAQRSAVQYINQSIYDQPHFSLWKDLKNPMLDSHIYQRFIKHFKYKKKRPIILTGHSKGGNLAMYAGCFTNKNIQDNIECIYNFDGPGFQDEIIRSKNYQKMLPKIISYIPHYSFFGIVLGHEEPYHVVKSYHTGMIQHNAFSWQVGPHHFIDDELSYESVQFAIKVILFLEKLSYEEKHLFIKTMFDLLESLELHTFSDLSRMSFKHLVNAIKELSLLETNVRKMLIEVIHMLWIEANKMKK